jgi:ATP synthase F1 delta subunit
MDSLTVDKIYGHALYDVAKERGIIEEISEEYKAVGKVFTDNPDLKRLFMIPLLSAYEKRNVAQKVFEGRILPELLNYLYVLIDEKRIGAWEDIGRYYEKVVLENNGLIKGVVYSAVPLDDDRIRALEKSTASFTGNNVMLESRIDKSLIGGVKIYIDGKLIDSSVKARLDNLRQRMKS